ncbi:MAG: PCMD domain-containing protein [Muribaculaceae bacterium]|nr:PCMD domain-containing protein [Muribaculaceae bacterium]
MFTFNKISGRFPWLSVVALAICFMASGCIENDLPYPHTQPNFTCLEVAHQSRVASIDSANRVVTVFLNEEADIKNVKVTDCAITPGAYMLDSMEFVSGIDLTTPYEVTLGLYYDFKWTVSAIQDIERYFKIANQVGASEIDVESHTVKAYVAETVSLSQIRVQSIKLAGTTATMHPNLRGLIVDFTRPVKITVSEFGRSTTWSIEVNHASSRVSIDHVDAWTNVAWAYAMAEAGKNNGFEYRKSGSNDWVEVPKGWITDAGGSFSACISHLSAETEYQLRAFSGDDHTEIVTFTTGKVVQLPNSNFENWWLDGKVWCPWGKDQEPFWGTGNKGATILGPSNTLPHSDINSLTGYAGAELQTKFVGIGSLGKLASGNLFSGYYVRTDGTDGVLSFGRPFTMRPTALKAKIKYTTAPISHASSGFDDLKGRPDTCVVWCALGDWDEPYEIRTKRSDRRLFDRNDPGVIAYGQVQYGYDMDSYMDVRIPIEYVSTDRVPRYIIVVASASKYGDYFTGGNGAILYVSSYELEYDYDN